jgi:protein-disulfide isomerase
VTTPLLEKYGTQIRFEFEHFPLRSIHRFAMEAAEAAECAADRGKFWEFVDIAFEKQPELKSEALRDWAKSLALDTKLFERCVTSKIKRDTILSDYEEGREKGVQGTPTYFVNGQKIETGLDTIGAAIESSLKGMQQRL